MRYLVLLLLGIAVSVSPIGTEEKAEETEEEVECNLSKYVDPNIEYWGNGNVKKKVEYWELDELTGKSETFREYLSGSIDDYYYEWV